LKKVQIEQSNWREILDRYHVLLAAISSVPQSSVLQQSSCLRPPTHWCSAPSSPRLVSYSSSSVVTDFRSQG
jgi:hypothetical protein